MGLLKAFSGSVKGALEDSWKEMYMCDAFPANVLVLKGSKKTGENSANTNGSANCITDGSLIVVPDGSCAIVTEGGKIHSVFSEPGENTFHSNQSGGFFSGGMGSLVKDAARRFSFGGEDVPITHRVYYVNTKEIMGNVFTPKKPIPVRICDPGADVSMDALLYVSGTYTFRITDPGRFYKTITGNVIHNYEVDALRGQLSSEVLTALQTVLAEIGKEGVYPYQLPAYTQEICGRMQTRLSAGWAGLRGITVTSVALSSISVITDDMRLIQEMQRSKAFQSPMFSVMTGAQLKAMQQTGNTDAVEKKEYWYCTECGKKNRGRFCENCGTKRYEQRK